MFGSSGLLALLLMFLETITSSAAHSNTLHPHCQEFCGIYSIPYPFGIGLACSRNSLFQLSCEKNNDGIFHPYPYPNSNFRNEPVFDFSLQHSQATMLITIGYDCYSNYRRKSYQEFGLSLMSTPFVVSRIHNRFISIGCNSVASFYSRTRSRRYKAGCLTFCYGESDVDSNSSGSCTGNGCCHTTLHNNLVALNGDYNDRPTEDASWKYNPCSYQFVADQDWFTFEASYLRGESFMSKYKDGVPMILQWAIQNITCNEAVKDISSYACKDRNSRCVDSPNSIGYTCNCTKGYKGNPYLEDGCRDVDECENSHPCKGICTNTEGSYTCSCIEGYYSKDPTNIECALAATNELQKSIKLILGFGLFLISVITSSIWIYLRHQINKFSRQKEKFFKQNGGLLLYEELKSLGESFTFKIFKKEELEKATNNFDMNLILGRGGQGTVYQGTLGNNMIVAIKRAKTVNESQKEEFIKEILIVSQINHNNVVKLLGCCLEVEVPMLVYEFVRNGSLYDLIHNQYNNETIALETRIRIAAESAEALAYLHSAASPPVLHRDVKSSNILINENYDAKVSDFGASILVVNDKMQLATVLQGTFGYLDPEYIRSYVFTEKSDVYSFGVVLLELLTRKHALYFEGSESEKNLASTFLSSMEQGRMVQCLDKQLVDEGQMDVIQELARLARQCLSMKSVNRPTMKEVAEELQWLKKMLAA